ncbi:MAG TPA: hypothetical protein PKD24_02160 [Pyrinomonadaceae bacterium]|nr:hypothetical protein [Pyrinomonadaceae bacterium]HMP64037.1 hypothetical protein [Pyrinomonadaceae bacterium]
MRTIIAQNNLDFRNEVEKIRREIDYDQHLPRELEPYRDWLVSVCGSILDAIETNFENLAKPDDSILIDIVSDTNIIARNVTILNSRYIVPVLRSKRSDLPALRLVSWLHESHRATRDNPFAISAGMFACLPYPGMPTIYFFPSSAHGQILYLPLLFHEFGHVLYAFHKVEMEALVKELQQKIAIRLQPSVVRNDRFSLEANRKLDKIAITWFEWTQELFCDAVGLKIGGPSFIHAFSMYCRMLGHEEFHVPEESLAFRVHPVSWIRVKLLASRADAMGFPKLAAELLEAWSDIAACSKITEEYFGFFSDAFLPIVNATIDDMLVESNPLGFDDANGMTLPVSLLNRAWETFLNDPTAFSEWENAAIDELLGITTLSAAEAA